MFVARSEWYDPSLLTFLCGASDGNCLKLHRPSPAGHLAAACGLEDGNTVVDLLTALVVGLRCAVCVVQVRRESLRVVLTDVVPFAGHVCEVVDAFGRGQRCNWHFDVATVVLRLIEITPVRFLIEPACVI